MTSTTTTCFLCKNPPVGECDFCELGKYCSEDHYKIHKNENNGECQPFQMVYKADKGKCLEATRNIKPFELVLEDKAAAWGTFENSKTYCLVCLEMVDDALNVCTDCNLPLCDTKKCRSSDIHQPECQILRNHKPEKLVITTGHPVYALITPLRVFSLSKSSSQKLQNLFKDIMSLTSHLDEERHDKQRWDRIKNASLPILHNCNLVEGDIFVIEEIIAILRTNCCGLTPRIEHFGASRGIALFPYFSMINHSCIANCRYTVSLDNSTISVRAMKAISKGEEISIHYVGISLGTLTRKKSFNNQWKFECHCSRCQDPSEFGTYLQAIKCEDCIKKDKLGFLLPVYGEIEEGNIYMKVGNIFFFVFI